MAILPPGEGWEISFCCSAVPTVLSPEPPGTQKLVVKAVSWPLQMPPELTVLRIGWYAVCLRAVSPVPKSAELMEILKLKIPVI